LPISFRVYVPLRDGENVVDHGPWQALRELKRVWLVLGPEIVSFPVPIQMTPS